jgi:hypothetical protein
VCTPSGIRGTLRSVNVVIRDAAEMVAVHCERYRKRKELRLARLHPKEELPVLETLRPMIARGRIE